jgi:hypothetical protein
MGRGDVQWNEMADGRFECPTAANCDDLTERWFLSQIFCKESAVSFHVLVET